MKGQIDRFVSIDNAGIHISTVGVGKPALPDLRSKAPAATVSRSSGWPIRRTLWAAPWRRSPSSEFRVTAHDVQRRADWRRDVRERHPV